MLKLYFNKKIYFLKLSYIINVNFFNLMVFKFIEKLMATVLVIYSGKHIYFFCHFLLSRQGI